MLSVLDILIFKCRYWHVFDLFPFFFFFLSFYMELKIHGIQYGILTEVHANVFNRLTLIEAVCISCFRLMYMRIYPQIGMLNVVV